MFFRDQNTPPDVQDVLHTAAILSISEFQVFHLAYASWHGYEADADTIEASFIPYMFKDCVPWWVRAFTRLVLRREQAGCLDPTEFGLIPRQATAQERRQGQLYILGLGLILLVLLILAERTGQWLNLPECFFPPCY